ncbi:MAG: aspartate aminotransferase family protein [Lachnotalea sp.]
MNNNTHILNPLFKKTYPVISHGKGIYMYDEHNTEYIDATSGAVLVSLGHGVTEMGDVLKKQADKISFAYRWDCITQVLEDACKLVCDTSDHDFTKVFYVCGGSEATEISMKLVRRYFINIGKNSKYKVISRHQSYHGSTMGALSITGFPARKAGYEDYLFEQGHIAPPYCYRCWYNKICETCNFECAMELETEIVNQGPDNVAAFIFEPVSGMSICGANPPKGYFQKIREICDKYNVLLISDEVMAGMGRTGKYFAYQNFDIKPDIITLGKALAGGYFPIGAVACSQKIYDGIAENTAEFQPGYSWAGNPLGSAVVCETFKQLANQQLVPNVALKGIYLMYELREMAKNHKIIGDVRGLGLMVGLEFVKDKETKETFDPSMKVAGMIGKAALEEKMFLEVSVGCNHGTSGDMAMVAPAFIVSYLELDEIVARIDKVVTKVEAQLGLSI